MNSAGLLTVRARFEQGSVRALAVHLARPAVARLFIGQNPEAVVKTVPYLYTLCAHAQRAAAQAALAAAVGEARRPVDDDELWIEFLHENLWRLLLDWPAALGLPPASEAFIAWRAARQGEERISETQKLLAGTLRVLAQQCQEQLGAPGPEPAFAFPALAPEAWLDYWQGGLSRLPEVPRPASVAAAFARRLAEVEAAAAALAAGSPYPVAAAGGDGWGVGQTLTARGVLTHAVHLDDERVEDYRVWAPTDCHFGDSSGLAALLAGRHFADPGSARQALEQAVLALDPCLPYTLELGDA